MKTVASHGSRDARTAAKRATSTSKQKKPPNRPASASELRSPRSSVHSVHSSDNEDDAPTIEKLSERLRNVEADYNTQRAKHQNAIENYSRELAAAKDRLARSEKACESHAAGVERDLNKVVSDRDRLHHDLQSARKENNDLKQNIASVEAQLHSRPLQRLQSRLDEALRDYNASRTSNSQLGLQLQQSEKRNSHLKQQLTALDTELQDQRAYIETSVTKAQSAAVKILSDVASSSLPDDQIRKHFENLFDRIADWARTNANRDPKATTSVAVLQKLSEAKIPRRQEDGMSSYMVFDLQDDTAMDTLLNAEISLHICKAFLRSPFFFADITHPITSSTTPPDKHIDTSIALDRILKRLCEAPGEDESLGHMWRASTVHTLTQSKSGRTQLEQVYHSVVREILQSVGPLLDPDLPSHEQQDFLEVVTEFGNFALRLWSQNHDVSYLSLHKLRGEIFRESRPDMEAAQALRLGKGDRRLDGRPVVVVLQPLILGRGNQDGKNYDKTRIWSKAAVWVSDRK